MTYNAEEHFKKLQIQSKRIIKILYSQDYLYASEIKGLKKCIDNTKVIGNKIINKIESCGIWFCPRCDNQKSRVAYAKSYQLINKINNLDIVPVVKLVTLKLPKVSIEKFSENKDYLRDCYYQLLKIKMYKANGTVIKFNNMILGSSIHYHMLFNTQADENTLLIGNHLHIIMFMRPSIASHSSITHIMLEKAWFEIIGYDKTFNHGSNKSSVDIKTIHLSDLPNTYSYCSKKINFDSLIINSLKFIELINSVKGKRFSSHNGIIKNFRREIQEEYQILMKELQDQQDKKHGYHLDLTFDERYEIVNIKGIK